MASPYASSDLHHGKLDIHVLAEKIAGLPPEYRESLAPELRRLETDLQSREDCLEERRKQAGMLGQAGDILESIGDAFYAVDADWRITYVNRRTEEWWQRKRDSLIGMALQDVFGEYQNVEGFQAMRRVMQTRQSEHMETFSPMLQTWLQVNVYPTLEGGLTIYFCDIQGRKRIEQALAELERKYRELVQYAPAAIYELDFHKRRFTTVNDAMLEMSGYSREELLTMEPLDLMDSEGRARFGQRMQRWLAGEESPKNVEYTIRAKDGHTICAQLYVTFTRDEQGRPRGAKVIGYDVTDQKRAEEEIIRSREELAELVGRFQEVLENSMDASYRRDLRRDRYDYMSPVIENIFGYSAGEIMQWSTSEVLERILPDDRQAIWDGLAEALEMDGAKLEYRFHCKDGSWRWIGDHVKITKDAHGEPLYRTGAVRDITTSKQAEDKLRQALAQAEEGRLLLEA